MYFVYILKTRAKPEYYTGVTKDLKRRVREHNSGNSDFTSRNKNYKLVWYCVFKDKKLAYDFEIYLKSSSGFAFRNKRLLKKDLL